MKRLGVFSLIILLAGISPVAAAPTGADTAEQTLKVDSNTVLELGGTLYRNGTGRGRSRYIITYLYGDHVWGKRLLEDGKSLATASVRLTRWQLNDGWRYLSPSQGQPPVAEVEQESKPQSHPKKAHEVQPLPAEKQMTTVPPPALETAAFHQVDNTLYGADAKSGSVTAIDVANGKPDTSKLKGGLFRDESVLRGPVAMTHIGNTLFVVDSLMNNVVAINLGTGKLDKDKFHEGVYKDEALLRAPSSILQVGDNLYVVGSMSNTVVALKPAAGPDALDRSKLNQGVLRDPNLEAPSSLVHIGNTLYVAGEKSNTIVAFDAVTGRVDTKRFQNGVFKDEANLRSPSAMTHTGNTIFVIGSQSNTIVALDTAAGGLDVDRFDKGVFHFGQESPRGFVTVGDVIYAVDSENNLLMALDGRTGAPLNGAALDRGGFSEYVTMPGRTYKKVGERATILNADSAVRTYAELAGQLPLGTQTVAVLQRVIVHGGGSAMVQIGTLVSQKEKEMLGVDLELATLEDIAPYSIVLLGPADPAPKIVVDHVAVFNLQAFSPSSLSDLLGAAVSQWAGRPAGTVLGSSRLRDGSSVIFLGSALEKN